MAEELTDQDLLTRVRNTLERLRNGSAEADRKAVERIRKVTTRHGVVSVTIRESDDHSGLVGLTVKGRQTTGEVDLSRIELTLGAVPGVKAVRLSPDPVDAEWLSGPRTPLQDEMIANGILPDPDPLTAPHLGLAVAEEAGYGAEGPLPLDGPTEVSSGEGDDMGYHGPVPVHQWEVNPQNPSCQGGESDLSLDGWDFSLWWQVHPAGLVYASIQALRGDTNRNNTEARPHPVGRAVAVNLVYDQRRAAVVAIYGTALDFRPFVRAFVQAFGLVQDDTTSISNQKDAPHEQHSEH